MAFTAAEAAWLLGLPKEIKVGTTTIDLGAGKNRLELYAPAEPAHEFLLEITTNGKISFKISLHHQEEPTHEGLLRIDFKGGHKNPETVTADVPSWIAVHVGRLFQNEAHIHYFVEGYRQLAWAVPLQGHLFSVTDIASGGDFANAVNVFAQQINLSPSAFAIQVPIL